MVKFIRDINISKGLVIMKKKINIIELIAFFEQLEFAVKNVDNEKSAMAYFDGRTEFKTNENENKVYDYISDLLKEMGFGISNKITEEEKRHLMDKIKHSSGSSFEIPEIEPLLNKLGIVSIKSNSNQKGDLTIQIYDNFTGFKPVIDFSIKSYIGGAPTLLNASGATVFTYLVNAPHAVDLIEDVNNIHGTSKIKDRITYLISQGINLKFSKSMDETFYFNLQMIDSRMPEILAGLVLTSYFVKGKKMDDVVSCFAIISMKILN